MPRFNTAKRPLSKAEFGDLVAKLVTNEGVMQEEIDLVSFAQQTFILSGGQLILSDGYGP